MYRGKFKVLYGSDGTEIEPVYNIDGYLLGASDIECLSAAYENNFGGAGDIALAGLFSGLKKAFNKVVGPVANIVKNNPLVKTISKGITPLIKTVTNAAKTFGPYLPAPLNVAANVVGKYGPELAKVASQPLAQTVAKARNIISENIPVLRDTLDPKLRGKFDETLKAITQGNVAKAAAQNVEGLAKFQTDLKAKEEAMKKEYNAAVGREKMNAEKLKKFRDQAQAMTKLQGQVSKAMEKSKRTLTAYSNLIKAEHDSFLRAIENKEAVKVAVSDALAKNPIIKSELENAKRISEKIREGGIRIKDLDARLNAVFELI